MSEDNFVYCLGIGAEHRPCYLREQCWHFKALRRIHFHVPVQQKWHLCEQGPGEKAQFLPLPTMNAGQEEGEEVV